MSTITHFPILTRATIASLTNFTRVCPATNDVLLDQSTFWTPNGLNWSAHVIGWSIAGGCAVLTTLISGTNIWLHCRNYNKKLEQRQIIRILLMPVVFSILSFVGYRFFRDIVYYQLARNTYEAFTIAAFMILMLAMIANSPAEQREVLNLKEKRKFVFPCCCIRYRPSKPYFYFTVKWSVMQFVIVKPLISIASVVTEVLGVFCGGSQSPYFANIYLEAIDFFSVSIALYGLITLYTLTHEELKGRRPLAKFMTIKIIVALVFYQGFVFTILQRYNVIKATQYWTASNVSAGLNALVTSAEMVLIALFQLYAFPHSEYKISSPATKSHTSFWRSFFHSQNYSDFLVDIFSSLKFFFDRIRRKPYTLAGYDASDNKYNLAGAFDAVPPPRSNQNNDERNKGGGEEARRYEVKMDNLNSNKNSNNNNSWSKSQEVGMEQEEEDYYPPQNQNQNHQQSQRQQQQQQAYYPSSPSSPSQQQHQQYYQSNPRPSYDRAQDSYDSNSRGEGEGRAHYSGNGQGPQGTGLPYRPLRGQSESDNRGYNAGTGGGERERNWNGGGFNAQ